MKVWIQMLWTEITKAIIPKIVSKYGWRYFLVGAGLITILCILLWQLCGTVICQNDAVTPTNSPIFTESVETVPESISDTFPTESELIFKNVTPGEIRSFGEYKFTSDGEVKPIDWIVLKIDGNKALILSVEGLDTQPFHEETAQATWAESFIHGWLKNNFYNKAFSESEKAQIQLTEVKPDETGNEDYKISDATDDYVFLLSVSEVADHIRYNDCLDDWESIMCCSPTDYVEEDVWLNNKGDGWWWLRTPSSNNTKACRVDDGGNIDYNGHILKTKQGLIRPAMWVIIE